MFQKLFKPPPPDFAATDVMTAPKKKPDSSAGNLFAEEMALPEVAELDSESAWAAFNTEPDRAAESPEAQPPDAFLPTTSFSVTQPMEYAPPVEGRKQAFSSGYMDVLNEIEQDQDQRKRKTRSS